MVEQVNAKLSQGYSFIAIFRMIIGGFLCKEDETNGISSRLESKKRLFNYLFETMSKPRHANNKFIEEKHHPFIEDQDAIILFFSKSEVG